MSEVEKLRLKMFNEIKQNKEVMAILNAAQVNDDIIKQNVSFIYDYIDAKTSVSKCEADGECHNENHYHNAELVIRGDFISTNPVVCPVYFETQQLTSRFIFKDYPPGSEKLNVGYLPARRSFNAFRTEMALLIEGLREMIYVSAPHNAGLLEEGTAFLVQALKNDKNRTVGVLDFPKFIRDFPSDIYKNKDVINEYIDKLLTIDFLLIHGLGNEETNTLIRETIIFPLIKGRADAKKPTIYLSELSLNELSRLYDPRRQDVRVKQIISLITNTIDREVYISATKI